MLWPNKILLLTGINNNIYNHLVSNNLYIVAFTRNVCGTEWPFMCVDVPLRNYSTQSVAKFLCTVRQCHAPLSKKTAPTTNQVANVSFSQKHCKAQVDEVYHCVHRAHRDLKYCGGVFSTYR